MPAPCERVALLAEGQDLGPAILCLARLGVVGRDGVGRPEPLRGNRVARRGAVIDEPLLDGLSAPLGEGLVDLVVAARIRVAVDLDLARPVLLDARLCLPELRLL